MTAATAALFATSRMGPPRRCAAMCTTLPTEHAGTVSTADNSPYQALPMKCALRRTSCWGGETTMAATAAALAATRTGRRTRCAAMCITLPTKRADGPQKADRWCCDCSPLFSHPGSPELYGMCSYDTERRPCVTHGALRLSNDSSLMDTVVLFSVFVYMTRSKPALGTVFYVVDCALYRTIVSLQKPPSSPWNVLHSVAMVL